MEKIHSSITGNREKIELVYEPSVSDENFYQELSKNREKDCRFQQTSVCA